MLKAFLNSFKVPDLRNKILFTLLIIAVFRFGSYVPVPVVDVKAHAFSAAAKAKIEAAGGRIETLGG